VRPPEQPAPDIALEQAKKKREQEEKAREAAEQAKKEAAEKAAAEQKAKDDARKAAEKAAAEQKAKEDAAKKAAEQKAAADKAAAEKAAAEKAAAEKAAAEKAAAEQKAKEDAAKKAAAEAAAKKAAADKALKDAFKNDIMAGMANGSADRNQAGGGGGRDNGYAAKVRACVQPGVAYPTPQRSGSTNPTAEYRVQLNSSGQVMGVNLTRSSGIPSFDRAVESGISRCNPFPKPSTGSYPSVIDVVYQMY